MLGGVSVTYQGEELGMTNTNISWEDTLDPAGLACGQERYQECSRDPERTPMQWNSDSNASFSSASHTWLPLNPNYPWLNVEKQLFADDIHNTHIGVYIDTMRVRNSIPYRSETFFHVIDSIFIAAHRNWKLLLNFGTERIVNLSSFLSSHGLPVGITEVAARSVNGKMNNSVGQLKDLNENVIMGQMEAVLLLDLINSKEIGSFTVNGSLDYIRQINAN